MPPKPWQTRKKPVQNISQIIQSNPTVKEQVPKLPPSQPSPNDKMSTNPSGTAASNSVSNASSGYGGYGGYSGMGGYGSSYGSSYGGLGGYGGYSSLGYGSSYGMGGMGMYGMGRYGLMGGQNQKGALVSTMMTLDSFSYLINCLCEIARSLDQNYEGLSLFYQSFKNLIKRLQDGVLGGFKWVLTKIKNFFLGIFRFIVENIFFMGQKNTKTKYKAIKAVITISIIALGVSSYPLIRKAIKNA